MQVGKCELPCLRCRDLELENGWLRQELSDYKNGVHQLVKKGWRPHPVGMTYVGDDD